MNWSVEQVCDCVTSKAFKAYRAVFRDGLVNGNMLLTITPEILKTNGIKNMCVHIYALALKLKKNIVPVKHEDFVFPDKNSVPTDVESVIILNAIPWFSVYREASFERLRNALM